MQGIVFRDLKPENLLVVSGAVKLADFGTAIDVRLERPLSRLVRLLCYPHTPLNGSHLVHI